MRFENPLLKDMKIRFTFIRGYADKIVSRLERRISAAGMANAFTSAEPSLHMHVIR